MEKSSALRSTLGSALVLCQFLCLLPIHESSYTTEVLRPAFEKTFTDRCTVEKYPFIEKYYKNLENPTDRYIQFIFHESGRQSGGFGDRIAGTSVTFPLTCHLLQLGLNYPCRLYRQLRHVNSSANYLSYICHYHHLVIFY